MAERTALMCNIGLLKDAWQLNIRPGTRMGGIATHGKAARLIFGRRESLAGV